MSLFQPSNQIKLTNVAVVRYKSHGKRFEIACYKNKILNWRSGVEWDLDEVLQIRSIFNNVSKGLMSSSEDLISAFGTVNTDQICKIILNKGEIQISESEREYMLEKQYTDICHMLTQMTINPNNNLPLSVKMIESELKESGFSVSFNKSTKEQALKALELLKKRIPNQIERTRMMIKLSTSINNKQNLMNDISEFNISLISTDENNDQFSIVFLCDPCYYRKINKLNYQLLLLDSNIKNLSNPKVSSEDKEASQVVPSCAVDSENIELEIENQIRRAEVFNKTAVTNREEIHCDKDTDIIKRHIVPKLNFKNNRKSENWTCHKCCVEFNSSNLFKQHYRSEWHVFNTKRIAKKMEPVSEKEFLELEQDIKMGFLAVE